MDWQIEPTTPWNYGLVVDPANPEATITVTPQKVGRVPFDTAAAPVVLQGQGQADPVWKLVTTKPARRRAAPRPRTNLLPKWS